MVSELIAGLGAFKTMMDMAKGLKDINDAAVRNTAVIELQEKILSTQAQQTALIEHVSELEKEVARLETWKAEKQRYELTELPPGVFVYQLKPDMQGSEPMHSICEKCYQNGKKSILHCKGKSDGLEHLVCHACEVVVIVGHYTAPNVSWDYDPIA